MACQEESYEDDSVDSNGESQAVGGVSTSNIGQGSAIGANSNFYTASQMMNTIQDTMKKVIGGEESSGGEYQGVELHKRLPDGRTVPLDESGMKATDVQMKLKQAADSIAALTSEQKVEWAKEQRLEGNRLFGLQDYAHAMDVYLTCLVAIDYKATEQPHSELRAMVERQVQLPVLLNLAACAMKMERYRKVEEFCNIALNDLTVTHCGQDHVKVWYRRGRARMLLGSYKDAKHDFQIALQKAHTPEETRAIQKDLYKLTTLVQAGKSNERKYQKAMQKIFQPTITPKPTPTPSLYSDLPHKPESPLYSTLRAVPRQKQSRPSLMDEMEQVGLISWVASIVTDCLRRVLGRWSSVEDQSVEQLSNKKKEL